MRFAYGVLIAALAVSAASHAQAPPAPRAPAAPPTSQAPASPWAYLPGPPEFVAGTMASSAKWSPDGRYLLAVRQKMTMRSLDDVTAEVSLNVWNAETKASTVVWRVESTQYAIRDVAWVPGTAVAFATVRVAAQDGARNTIWRIDARRGTAAEVAGTGPEDQVSVSPLLPYAVLYGSDGGSSYLRTLNTSGTLGPKLEPAQASTAPIGWSADGAMVYLPGVTGGSDTRSYWTYRPGTEVISSTSDPLKFAEPIAHNWPFHLEATAMDLTPRKPAQPAAPWSDSKVRPLWLVQGEGTSAERTLLAAEADAFEVSPRGDAVAYTGREGCFVVPVLKVDRARMEAARAAAQRAELMSNGKQVAIAMIMYAMDNDETYPSAGTDLPTLLGPYAKSADIFNGLTGPGDGFVYTYPGGSMNDVKDPANTQMGYIPAPGGRVIVYADGHVGFVPDNAPSR